VGPDDIKTKSNADLVKCLKDHYDPKPSVIVERYKFNTLSKTTDQTVSKYVVALRAQAERCNYGTSLDNMLRDRLVCGINNQAIQQRLLSEATLTLQSAWELATAIETAAAIMDGNRATAGTTAGTTASGVLWSETRTKKPPLAPGKGKPGRQCYRCGGDHLHTTCKYKDAECHHCHKRGHIAPVCKSKPRTHSKTRLS
jgi:hypothetical protein